MESVVAGVRRTDTERARRQGERLCALRKRLDVDKGLLMAALRLKTTNGYDMYERGQSVIRLDRAEDWAKAFDMPPTDFAGYILGHREIEDVLPDPWSMAEALRGHIPEADIPELVAEWAGRSVLEQKAAVEGIKDNANRARARATAARRCNRPA